MRRALLTALAVIPLVFVACGKDKDDDKDDDKKSGQKGPFGQDGDEEENEGDGNPGDEHEQTGDPTPPKTDGGKKSTETTSSTKYTYDFDDNGCKTGKHAFGSMEAYCKALLDDELNNHCARDMREAQYEAKKCK